MRVKYKVKYKQTESTEIAEIYCVTVNTDDNDVQMSFCQPDCYDLRVSCLTPYEKESVLSQFYKDGCADVTRMEAHYIDEDGDVVDELVFDDD